MQGRRPVHRRNGMADPKGRGRHALEPVHEGPHGGDPVGVQALLHIGPFVARQAGDGKGDELFPNR